MSTRLRGTIAIVVSTVLLLGVVLLSRLSVTTSNGDMGVLRLSWSVLPERLEECHTLTDEELARRPAHMRQAEVCEGTALPYRLQVRIDGRSRADELVVGGGARSDRRIYVLREFRVRPGIHPVSVSFTIEDSTLAAGMADGEVPDERFAPRRLVWSGAIALDAGRVTLVRYDGQRRQLRPVRKPPTP